MEIQELREMVDEDPEDVELRYSLGRKLLDDMDGDPREAVVHLSVVLEAEPHHLPSMLALGQAYLRIGKDDEAREVLEEGLALTREATSADGGELGPDFEQLLAEI